MSLANTLGYASSTYALILIGQPAFKNEIEYPKKWVAISITLKKISVTLPKHSKSTKCPRYDTSYKIKLLTSQNEHYQFQDKTSTVTHSKNT